MDFSLSTVFEHFTFATWCVAIVLIVMSVLSVAVALNRLFHFTRARAQSLLFARTIADAMEKTNVDEVLANAKDDEYKFSYLAHIVTSGLTEARDLKARAEGTPSDLSTVQSSMERAVADEHSGLSRWLTILATVASTSPFVGLLGTVFGIINSFKGMEATESAGLSAVAGGIAEALVMTGFGLVVAIPAVWLYNWANASIEGFSKEMGTSASEVFDYVKKNIAKI